MLHSRIMTTDVLAGELGTTDRTLRRLADTGTLRVSRRGRGHRHASPAEQAYLRSHWQLLSALREALRTERRVRAAIVFGSVARGDDRIGSDIDLLIDEEGESNLSERRHLKERLAAKLQRKIDLFYLADLVEQPAILGPIVGEARPIVDRGSVWPRLVASSKRAGQGSGRGRTPTLGNSGTSR
jgi:predicted nucleotidyltransferase